MEFVQKLAILVEGPSGHAEVEAVRGHFVDAPAVLRRLLRVAAANVGKSKFQFLATDFSQSGMNYSQSRFPRPSISGFSMV